MAIELWIAFVGASVLLLASPGPTVLLAVAFALNNGRKSALATVPGATFGDFVAMTLSLVGAGAILSASAELFNVLKLFGAGYLIWMGIQLFNQRAAENTEDEEAPQTGKKSMRRMFWSAFAVTALHPGGFVFFISFVPQFIDPAKPALAQFVILEATFLALTAINMAFWAFAADAVRVRLQRPRLFRWFQRLGGTSLIGLGIYTALGKRD